MNKLIQSSKLIDLAIKRVAENNFMPPEGSSIGIAMSGGVDSSVAAALLSRMNYKVFGITGWLMEGAGKCCDSGMLDSARISETLGLEHHSIDLREYFNSTIISPFINSYSVGRTPVPCMPCNTEVKWGSLLQSCNSMGADYLASGHYSRLIKHSNGNFSIGRASDPGKDQSYMLWGLDQNQLSRTVFPLANFTKEESRELAKEFGLGNWDKEESQDICFIPNKTKEFLMEKLGERPGEIKEIKTGKILGEHTGTHFYTVGQRKGIGLSSAEPIYVIKLDPINNIVYVGEKSELYSSGLEVEFANWQVEPKEPFRAMVKIRYNADAVSALVVPLDNKLFKVQFDSEVASVTPGQAVVAYDSENEFIIAGGWISRAIDS